MRLEDKPQSSSDPFKSQGGVNLGVFIHLSGWQISRVMASPTRWYESWEEAQDKSYKLDPSMFPSPSKAKLPLERCMRFLPHHQDTGGFFVCVLKKVC